MEIPVRCDACDHQTMVDWENLEGRPLSKLITVYGYTCQVCNVWKPCWYSNRQLDDAMRRLISLPPTHPSFLYHFARTMKRAKEIQQRGRNTANGAFGHQNLAQSG